MSIAAIIRLLLGLLTPAFDGRRIAAAAGRAAIAGICLLLACLALLAAIGLGGAALWVFAAASLGSVRASLVVAGAFGVLALLLLLGAWLAMRAGRKPAAKPQGAGTDPAAAMLALAGNLFSQHKSALLLAALVAGLFAERMQKRD